MPRITEPSLPEPPRWAQDLLLLVVRRDRAEEVSGDLLEEYRDAVLPGRGTAGANRWYVRQVAGFLFGLIWPFAAAVAAAQIIRELADAFNPPAGYDHPYAFRSALSTYAAVGTYVLGGFYGGLRIGRVSGGITVAIAGHLAGTLISIAFTAMLFFAVIVRDLPMLLRFQMTGGWEETFSGIAVLNVPVAILGAIGGWAGVLMSARRRQRIT